MPPLPDAPLALKLRLTGTYGTTNWANIMYLKYTSGTPSATDLSTLASGVRSAWSNGFASVFHTTMQLTLVEITDISSRIGNQGTNTSGVPCSKAGNQLPANVAVCITKIIARRYRGGHPRMYMPGMVQGNLLDQRNWTAAAVTEVQTGANTFLAAVNALTSPTTGPVKLANVSYWFTSPPKTPPQLKPTPDVDLITGVKVDNRVDSQRRRLD